MAARLEALGVEFLEAFGAMTGVADGLRHVTTTPPCVSTITCTGRLDVAALPVDDMRLALDLAEALGEQPFGFSLDCDLAKRATRRGGGADKRFRYQLPLKRRGKSLKLFHNGSVHATGCASPLEFVDMLDALTGFVDHTAGLRVRLMQFEVQLINLLFVALCPRTRRPLLVAPGALRRRLGGPTDFDTERHPSVKMPVMHEGVKVATACMFQTGSVSVMGAKQPAHLALAYRRVCQALDDAAPEVCTPDPATTVRTTTAKQPLCLVEGYPFGAYSCCL